VSIREPNDGKLRPMCRESDKNSCFASLRISNSIDKSIISARLIRVASFRASVRCTRDLLSSKRKRITGDTRDSIRVRVRV